MKKKGKRAHAILLPETVKQLKKENTERLQTQRNYVTLIICFVRIIRRGVEFECRPSAIEEWFVESITHTDNARMAHDLQHIEYHLYKINTHSTLICAKNETNKPFAN